PREPVDPNRLPAGRFGELLNNGEQAVERLLTPGVQRPIKILECLSEKKLEGRYRRIERLFPGGTVGEDKLIGVAFPGWEPGNPKIKRACLAGGAPACPGDLGQCRQGGTRGCRLSGWIGIQGD